VSTRLASFDTLGHLPGIVEGLVDAADPAERFENALHNVARGWRSAVDRRLNCLGVSMVSWMAIAAASQVRSPLSQSELADALSISDASMVRTTDRLVKAGLAIREPSLSDRRVNRIVVTEAGHRLCAQAKSEVVAVRHQLLVRIELEELAHLTELLEQLEPMA
jgi:MarR family transcriptional regulator, transcriptional regulator for hemolysin